MKNLELTGKTILQENYEITEEPYYEPVGKEVELFKTAFYSQIPISLIGPTGCGKTALTKYMAYVLRKEMMEQFEEEHKAVSFRFPYNEVGCNEDTSANDLIGRKNINSVWEPGSVYTASKKGGLIVLDEILEAREDVTVVIHSLTDDRRYLPVLKKGEIVIPPENFGFVICYNPGYSIITKNLKASTRQRFVTISMDYPPKELETKIVMESTGADRELASKLVRLAGEIRSSARGGNNPLNLQEGASTRLLNYASKMYLTSQKRGLGLTLEDCIENAIFNSISTEETDLEALRELNNLLWFLTWGLIVRDYNK